MRTALIYIIKAYQLLISPYLAPSCRYTPSCSCYAQEALQQHGAVKGSWLSVKRVCRCHPWHEGGYDPVPPTNDMDAHHGSDSVKTTTHPIAGDR